MKPLNERMRTAPRHNQQLKRSTCVAERSVNDVLEMSIRLVFVALFLAALMMTLSIRARAQSTLIANETTNTLEVSTPPVTIDIDYQQPTERTKIKNYIFDTYGPYPVAGSLTAAGMSQFTNSPPEWKQGFVGYSKRFGSDFGIVGVGTTTRYALAELFREDTLYYRCECSGFLPRLSHAAVSTLTARRGIDGHRVFSVPALIAPYAGATTAVYGWYPDRFGAKDAFRIGNYSLLSYVGGNILLEFFYRGPHSLLSRVHLNNSHGSPVRGPN